MTRQPERTPLRRKVRLHAPHAGAKHPRSQQNKASFTSDVEGKNTFNHAMVYVKDVDRGLAFYRDLLGFKLIEDFRYENEPVYARLRAPGGDGSISKSVNSTTSAAISSKRGFT